MYSLTASGRRRFLNCIAIVFFGFLLLLPSALQYIPLPGRWMHCLVQGMFPGINHFALLLLHLSEVLNATTEIKQALFNRIRNTQPPKRSLRFADLRFTHIHAIFLENVDEPVKVLRALM